MTREDFPDDVPRKSPGGQEYACPPHIQGGPEDLQTRLARRNRQLGAVNAELRRMDRTRATFISTAAHELRSPLASITGYVEMLLEGNFGPLTDAQRERLEIVQRSARRLLKTTDTLLDLTRMESGQMALTPQPRDLAALIEEVLAEFEPQIAAQDQRLAWHAAPDLPPALCDEMGAAEIVDNLLSNASKYTPPGGEITVGLERAEAEGFLEVSVADTGVGIPAKDQGRLFSRFFRGENGRRQGANGVGLGLYITKSLVALHGGRIWFDSARDEGSTFHVTFPVAEGTS